MEPARIQSLLETYRHALVDDVVPFWERHSVDRECGGFFTCLDRDGSVYGTDKPVWLQGRAVWLFATLYRDVEPRETWSQLARHGFEFLTRSCFDERGKMYFLVSRDGRPLQMRRYVFSEVFGVLGGAALARATGDDEIRRWTARLFDAFLRHHTTPGLLTPKIDPTTRPMKGLSPLMCLLSMADAMVAIDEPARYEKIIDDTIEEILRDFVCDKDECVLETVAPDGSRIDEPEGRVMNPGHAIEAAWFIMQVGRRRDDDALIRRALPMLDWALRRGWDGEYGGLLYFIDVAGRPSPRLEHDMKLWWPHCEALIATLMAWQATGERRWSDEFVRMHDWTFAHFPDPEFGEWYGYLRRDGTLSSAAKGGIWKGAFHVPRALLMCWKMLEESQAG